MQAGGNASVTGLVERARMVINRRMEQSPAFERQQSQPKVTYASSNGDGSWAPTPDHTKGPKAYQVPPPSIGYRPSES